MILRSVDDTASYSALRFMCVYVCVGGGGGGGGYRSCPICLNKCLQRCVDGVYHIVYVDWLVPLPKYRIQLN